VGALNFFYIYLYGDNLFYIYKNNNLNFMKNNLLVQHLFLINICTIRNFFVLCHLFNKNKKQSKQIKKKIWII